MNKDQTQFAIQTLAKLVPSVPADLKESVLIVLTQLKQDFSLMLEAEATLSESDKMIDEFKEVIESINKKMKKLNYGTQGYLLVYAVCKQVANIDPYKIQEDMKVKYSKNKASNVLRSLALAGDAVLKDCLDVAKTVEKDVESYIEYLPGKEKTEYADSEQIEDKINISSKANWITEEMVKNSNFDSSKYEYKLEEDKIPW